ncbi:MAG: hypothetical protein RL329_1397 [Bacteroidota bacterium]|jgi:hypothetical protein
MKKAIFLIALSTSGQMAMAQLFGTHNPDIVAVKPFSHQIAAVKIADSWHFVPLENINDLSKDHYPEVHSYQDGYALVLLETAGSSKRIWQFRDTKGALVGNTYDAARSFCNGFAAVQQKGKWGLINRQLKQVIDFKYDNIGDVSENRLRVGLGKNALKFKLIDTNELEFPISLAFPHLGRFSHGLSVVSADEKPNEKGYINPFGNVVIPCKKRRVDAGFFKQGYAPVCEQPGVLSFIDLTGKVRFSFPQGLDAKNLPIHGFSNGRAAVKKAGKWGFINLNGHWIGETYDQIKPFSEGIAGVLQGKEWFFIDTLGRKVSPETYKDLQPCSSGVAWVQTKQGWHPLSFLKPPLVTVTFPDTTQPIFIHFDMLLRVKVVSTLAISVPKVWLNDQLVSKIHWKMVQEQDTYSLECRLTLDTNRLGNQEIRVEVGNYVGAHADTRFFRFDPTIQYHALLIANNHYVNSNSWQPLDKPIADAEKVAKILKEQYQFSDVQILRDATYQQMKTALKDFGKKHGKRTDNILLFYAGHGNNIEGIPCLVPVDAADETDLTHHFTCLDLIEAVDSMPKVRHIEIILDACLAGAFALDVCTKPTRSPQQPPYVLGQPELTSRYVMTSAHKVKVGDESVFIQSLCNVLEANQAAELPCYELYSGVATKVRHQNPYQYVQRTDLKVEKNKGGHLKLLKKK